MKDIIGIIKENMEKGEVLASIDLCSGKVTSDKIRFFPYGKQKLRKKLLGIGIDTVKIGDFSNWKVEGW